MRRVKPFKFITQNPLFIQQVFYLSKLVENPMGELKVIGSSPTLMVGDRIEGEIHITWSPTNNQEVAYAQKIFEKYLLKGWLAIGEKKGSKTQIFQFDPSLERIVLAPLMMGG